MCEVVRRKKCIRNILDVQWLIITAKRLHLAVSILYKNVWSAYGTQDKPADLEASPSSHTSHSKHRGQTFLSRKTCQGKSENGQGKTEPPFSLSEFQCSFSEFQCSLSEFQYSLSEFQYSLSELPYSLSKLQRSHLDSKLITRNSRHCRFTACIARPEMGQEHYATSTALRQN